MGSDAKLVPHIPVIPPDRLDQRIRINCMTDGLAYLQVPCGVIPGLIQGVKAQEIGM